MVTVIGSLGVAWTEEGAYTLPREHTPGESRWERDSFGVSRGDSSVLPVLRSQGSVETSKGRTPVPLQWRTVRGMKGGDIFPTLMLSRTENPGALPTLLGSVHLTDLSTDRLSFERSFFSFFRLKVLLSLKQRKSKLSKQLCIKCVVYEVREIHRLSPEGCMSIST